MPFEPVSFGPYSAVYIGDGPPSGAVLTEISSLRTKGSVMQHSVPEQFVEVVGNSIPIDYARLQVDLTFVGRTDNVLRLAMGTSISTPVAADTPTQFAKYTVLLLSNDESSKDNVLIPECYTFKRLNLNREKRNQTEIPISFVFQRRNVHKRLYYMDTLANLLALTEMTGRSPF